MRPDAVYVQARRVLLDALEALGDQRGALVLVGAQAIYLHTGEGDLAVAPYTSDGDIALDPSELSETPRLEEAMRAGGFVLDLQQPGVWVGPEGVMIDLLVPEAVGGGGRRGARLGEHGNRAARKARGLEAVLVDNEPTEIAALAADDERRFEIAVAGPAALLVAKLHKLGERQDVAGRSEDKDALDVLRLLRAIPTQTLAEALDVLRGDVRSGVVTLEAVDYLRALFAEPTSPGSQMAARATTPLEDADVVSASSAALASDLLAAVSSRG
jgi:hypothetical protein